MEISKTIPISDFSKGYYIELSCCMCSNEETVAASSEEELTEILDEKGWKELTSDEYQLIGHHCGCDYRD